MNPHEEISLVVSEETKSLIQKFEDEIKGYCWGDRNSRDRRHRGKDRCAKCKNTRQRIPVYNC